METYQINCAQMDAFFTPLTVLAASQYHADQEWRHAHPNVHWPMATCEARVVRDEDADMEDPRLCPTPPCAQADPLIPAGDMSECEPTTCAKWLKPSFIRPKLPVSTAGRHGRRSIRTSQVVPYKWERRRFGNAGRALSKRIEGGRLFQGSKLVSLGLGKWTGSTFRCSAWDGQWVGHFSDRGVLSSHHHLDDTAASSRNRASATGSMASIPRSDGSTLEKWIDLPGEYERLPPYRLYFYPSYFHPLDVKMGGVRGTLTTRGANLMPLHRPRAAPGSWVEVMRAPRASEGRNGNGCWFHYAAGSGVYVNIGHTWVARSKHGVVDGSNESVIAAWLAKRGNHTTAKQWLRTTGERETSATTKADGSHSSNLGERFTSQSSSTDHPAQELSRNSTPHFRSNKKGESKRCSYARCPTELLMAQALLWPRGGTDVFPAAAAELGMDSVQIENVGGTYRAGAELVLTTTQCIEGGNPQDQDARSNTCIHGLRTGYAATRPCECDSHLPMLNCARLG